jgi:ribA/ribD-fused uncharacterized protein
MSKNLRTYNAKDVISFRKTNETFGGLSNMSAGYSINVNGIIIPTVEHLYQACRFPDYPEVQEAIILENSPMNAKKISRLNSSLTRPDWEQVRIGIMRWCLQIKLSQNWSKFSELLNQTGDKAIVEFTFEDKLWGATLEGDKYIGVNALGRLLMELREKHTKPQNRIYCVDPLKIDNFKLFNDDIEQICDELYYGEYSENFDHSIELI